MTTPRPAMTDSHPVWVHLMTLAAVAVIGILLVVFAGLAAIPWPETVAVCVWITVLCVVFAGTLSARVGRRL